MLEPIDSVAGGCEARTEGDGAEGMSTKGSISSGLWEERDKYFQNTPKVSGFVMISRVTGPFSSLAPSSNGGLGSCSGWAASALAFAASNRCFFVRNLPIWVGTVEVGM